MGLNFKDTYGATWLYDHVGWSRYCSCSMVGGTWIFPVYLLNFVVSGSVEGNTKILITCSTYWYICQRQAFQYAGIEGDVPLCLSALTATLRQEGAHTHPQRVLNYLHCPHGQSLPRLILLARWVRILWQVESHKLPRILSIFSSCTVWKESLATELAGIEDASNGSVNAWQMWAILSAVSKLITACHWLIGRFPVSFCEN